MISECKTNSQKQCSKCKKIKPFSEFRKNKNNRFGLTSYCKECLNQYYKYYYKINRTKIRENYVKSKKSYPEKLEEKRYCLICNVELSLAQINNIYCSKKCMGIACRKPEAELNPGFRGYGWNLKRNLIRERDNYTCQICGVTENYREHDVHHIIPYHTFKDKKLAGKNDNLITLCARCHTRADKNAEYIQILQRKIIEDSK